MQIKGKFSLTMKAEPPYDAEDGISLGLVRFDKTFEGALSATSLVTMIGARTAVANSAGYVAIERVKGSLDGKHGSFVLQHSGTMDRGESKLVVSVVPDSGTGELSGLRGTMAIDVADGQHHYTFDYQLA